MLWKVYSFDAQTGGNFTAKLTIVLVLRKVGVMAEVEKSQVGSTKPYHGL